MAATDSRPQPATSHGPSLWSKWPLRDREAPPPGALVGGDDGPRCELMHISGVNAGGLAMMRFGCITGDI